MHFATNGFETGQVWQSPCAGSGHTNRTVLESWNWGADSCSKLKLKISIEVLRTREGGAPGRKGPERRRFMVWGNFFPPSLGVVKEERGFCSLFQCSLITVELWVMFPFKTSLTHTLVLSWVLLSGKQLLGTHPYLKSQTISIVVSRCGHSL